MKTFTLAFIAFTIANFTIALTGAYSTSNNGAPKSLIAKSNANSHCDFWLKQQGDQAFLAVKHSYCVRRGGY